MRKSTGNDKVYWQKKLNKLHREKTALRTVIA